MPRYAFLVAVFGVICLAGAQAQQATAQFQTGRCSPAPGSDKWPLVQVYFDTGSAKIRAVDEKKIAEAAKLAKDNFIQQICLMGVADKQGDAKANERLANQRAQNVGQGLVKGGVAASAILLQPLGEPGGTVLGGVQRGAQADRRVDIRFAR